MNVINKLQFYFVYGSIRRMFWIVRVSQLSLPTFTLTEYSV